jgi:hypothetical protein
MRLLRTKAFVCRIISIVWILLFASVVSAEIKIKDSKHNLSASGLVGTVHAQEETQICIFCHTPHNALPSPAQPLWNHYLSSQSTYKVYWSNQVLSYTFDQSQAWTVDMPSKLCLSCHDGTVAIGAVQSRAEDIAMSISDCIDASGKLAASCQGNLGTDLSGGHPISIVLNQNLINTRMQNGLSGIKIPSDQYVKLYPKGCSTDDCRVECTSCHDPHINRAIGDDPNDSTNHNWPPFWQKAYYNDVCEACHDTIPPADFQW